MGGLNLRLVNRSLRAQYPGSAHGRENVLRKRGLCGDDSDSHSKGGEKFHTND